jgi:acetyltransferase
VRQFTQIDDAREMALVALDESSGDETIVGVARYVAETEDGESAEFRHCACRCLAGTRTRPRAMEMLIEGARRRGLRRLFGNILAVNTPMRASRYRWALPCFPIPRTGVMCRHARSRAG